MRSPRFIAASAGVCYLLNIVTILLAILCLRGIFVPGNFSASASNLTSHEALFRLGIALELISSAFSIAVAVLLFELLRPVNATVSLLAACFRLIACAVAIMGYIFQLAPLQILGGAQSVGALNSEDAHAVAFLVRRLSGAASDMVIVLFGFYFVLIGYLFFRSNFVPRWLGVIAMLGGVAALVFLAPPLARYLSPYILGTGFVVEVTITFWLLIKVGKTGDGRDVTSSKAPF